MGKCTRSTSMMGTVSSIVYAQILTPQNTSLNLSLLLYTFSSRSRDFWSPGRMRRRRRWCTRANAVVLASYDTLQVGSDSERHQPLCTLPLSRVPGEPTRRVRRSRLAARDVARPAPCMPSLPRAPEEPPRCWFAARHGPVSVVNVGPNLRPLHLLTSRGARTGQCKFGHGASEDAVGATTFAVDNGGRDGGGWSSPGWQGWPTARVIGSI